MPSCLRASVRTGVTRYLLTHRVLVPGCRVVMDMDKDMAGEEVLVAGRAPTAAACDATYNIEEEHGRDGGELAGVGVELATHSLSNLHFFQCHCLLSPSLLTI